VKGDEGFGKKEEEVEKIENIGRERYCGVNFFHNTKPFLFEELKNCIE